MANHIGLGSKYADRGGCAGRAGDGLRRGQFVGNRRAGRLLLLPIRFVKRYDYTATGLNETIAVRVPRGATPLPAPCRVATILESLR